MTHFEEIKNMSLEDFATLLAYLLADDDVEAFMQARENYIEYLQSEVQ